VINGPIKINEFENYCLYNSNIKIATIYIYIYIYIPYNLPCTNVSCEVELYNAKMNMYIKSL
jgi:hypothetical protein